VIRAIPLAPTLPWRGRVIRVRGTSMNHLAL
jgi:hypothetical protein